MSLTTHLEKIVAFNAVVKAGSIRKAAMNLNITQPALSRSISILERAMECRLLIRDRDGVKLTQQGSELFAFSENLVREAIDVERRIHHGDEDLDSSFVIGTYDSIAIYFFPAFLQHASSTQKNLRLNLRTAGSQQLMKDLRAGLIDLAVSVNPDKSRTTTSLELYRDHYGFFANPQSRDRKSETFIYVANAADLNGRKLEDFGKQFGISKRKTLLCENFETVRALTEVDLGIGILPFRVAERGVKRNDLESIKPGPKIPERFGEHVISFSYLKSREGDSSIQWIYREISRFLNPVF